MDSRDAKTLRQLEDENRKLKHVAAEMTLDNRALKDVLSKNFRRLWNVPLGPARAPKSASRGSLLTRRLCAQ
jgi:hypothetical protein